MINKQALIKLAQVRLAINYVLRNRMQKQAGGLSRLGYDAAKFYGGAAYAGLRELDDKHQIVGKTMSGARSLSKIPAVRNAWNNGVVRNLSAPWDKAKQDWNSNYNKAWDQAFPMTSELEAINNPELDRRQREWEDNYMKQNPMPPDSPFNSWWLPR